MRDDSSTDFDLEPLARDALPDGERAAFAVRVPADLLYFEGHFPGDPILPGVAQVASLVLGQIQALWPELGEPVRLTRLKFKRPIVPGDELRLTLERSSAGAPRVHFTLERAGEACTSGAMTFATASSPRA